MACGHFLADPAEDRRPPVHLVTVHVDVVQHGPHPLVAGMRSFRFRPGLPRITKQRLHHLLGRADQTVDAVHRSHGGHLLTVRFGAAAVLMVQDRRRVCRPADGNTLAVGRLDENLPFLLRRRARKRDLKGFGLLRHLSVHAFQTVHVLVQPQDLLDGLAHLAEGFFHREVLVPIL